VNGLYVQIARLILDYSRFSPCSEHLSLLCVNNSATAVHGDNCSDSSSSPGKREAQLQDSHQKTYKYIKI